MRERVSQLGGTFNIRRRAGERGTIVEAFIAGGAHLRQSRSGPDNTSTPRRSNRGGAEAVLIITRDSATFEFMPTPARRMLHFDFQGKPNLEELKPRLAQADGAFVRVRWVIPEEDRAIVDRDAMRALLSSAAEVKLEERIVPVVRTRAAGITQAHTLAEKLAKWASTTEVEGAPLLERLQLLESTEPEAIVGELLREQKTLVNCDRSDSRTHFDTHETDQREPKTSGKRNEAAAHRLQSQLAEAS
jgi:hypothetical protein